ncbi:hypothetical protein FJM67_10020 [Maribrevibacterium harenarium]|uniref:Uncharacterized protein n=1 Tax=Maribrevibacterium harenarium TaxID=2589817 RepID=A0A501WU40_9GAMM|nr:hypothetical protein [Maribrevibacterium harenarium]TPE50887.1 hypothetical protein FJM67_10020 [Maribrevibacterium harenarium]
MLEFIISLALLFCLLVGLLLFFALKKRRLPYYQVSQQDCVRILEQALSGELSEYDWQVFIGFTVTYDEDIEALRLTCAQIDEDCTKNARLVQGKLCVCFTKEGMLQLESLLDEWRHKVAYHA